MKELTGSVFRAMTDNGIKNLIKNKKMLNDLNVFPVPDGDTGTNMVMTLKYGFNSVSEKTDDLSRISAEFASSAVFGARGNSGVIFSQFFKGLAKGFEGLSSCNSQTFYKALEKGYEYAYCSVAKPVEGTMLTVIKDGNVAAKKSAENGSVKTVVEAFLNSASTSLANTPNQLPVLKKAGVVDSGGSGVVCFFEGVLKYLNGETINADETELKAKPLDLSKITKDTPLNYGYCVEGLIQLRTDAEDFDAEKFRKELSELGNSVVATTENDKLKLHVHTKNLGKLMGYCQKFGEFITVKIENMSVQNILNNQTEAKKFLYREEANGEFAVVAVAPNHYMQRKFFEMGADVVIMSDIAPSSQDFIDAFMFVKSKEIIVFPNSSNSILACVQAGGLYRKAKISVLNSRSVAECYSALSVMDFDSSVEEAIVPANQVINDCYQVVLYHAVKDIKFGNEEVDKNDFFALENNKKILATDGSLENAVIKTIKKVLSKKPHEILTVFYAGDIAPEYVDYLIERISGLNFNLEIASVCTMESSYSLTLLFE